MSHTWRKESWHSGRRHPGNLQVCKKNIVGASVCLLLQCVFITAGPSTKQYSSIYYPFESGWVLGKKKHGEKHFRDVGLLQAERDRHHLVGLGEQGKSAAAGTSKLAAVHAPCPAALRARVRARQSQGMTRVNSFLGPVDDYVTTNTTLTKSQSHKRQTHRDALAPARF